MTTKYFMLTKSATNKADDNADNHIIHLNPGKRQVFLLPEVNLDYYWKKGLFECQLIEWSKQFCKSDKLFLDIGAHTGTYAISLTNSAREVVAFEPQRSTYYALCGSVAASGLSAKIVCHKYGLGSEEQVGEQTLKIVSNDGGGSSLLPGENESVIREETVEIRTLDSFKLREIGFIKMDVENNELQVLMGSQNTLKRSNYPKILFEMNETNRELTGFLENIYYQIIPINGYSNMFLAVHTGVIEICG
jgi:FkbM family methyltransferase